MTDRDERNELPLPSEDTGDLAQPPAGGDTDDFLVAREEGLPYVPPTERVLSEPRLAEGGPDAAGAADDDALALRLEDARDDLGARALDALRRSDVVAGDRLGVVAVGSTVLLTGEVESVDVLDEILGLLGDLDGVDEVVDQTTLRGDIGTRDAGKLDGDR